MRKGGLKVRIGGRLLLEGAQLWLWCERWPGRRGNVGRKAWRRLLIRERLIRERLLLNLWRQLEIGNVLRHSGSDLRWNEGVLRVLKEPLAVCPFVLTGLLGAKSDLAIELKEREVIALGQELGEVVGVVELRRVVRVVAEDGVVIEGGDGLPKNLC
jgi:hypothetical protein